MAVASETPAGGCREFLAWWESRATKTEGEAMRTVGRTRKRHEGEVLKGLAAGLCAGLVASWTMNQFQTVWSHVAEGDKQLQSRRASRQSGGGRKDQQKQKQSEAAGGEGGGDDATVKAATAISAGVFDHELTKSEKKVAGPAVHYAMGATSGAIYGVLAELTPPIGAETVESTQSITLDSPTALWEGTIVSEWKGISLRPDEPSDEGVIVEVLH